MICRDVLLYLTAAARTMAERRLRDALRPGRYLLLCPPDAPAEPSACRACWGTGAVAYLLKPLPQ